MAVITRDTTGAIVDGIIKFVAAGGFVATALALPNAVQLLDKPLGKLMDGLDERQKMRELRRIIHYMKRSGLIRYNPNDYEHGIKLTRKGKRRLARHGFASILVASPQKWDKQWRLVFFDIPENQKAKRNSLTLKLKEIGFKQLQFSIWVHPFPCRSEIEAVSDFLQISKYISYVEVSRIDSAQLLKKRFAHLLK